MRKASRFEIERRLAWGLGVISVVALIALAAIPVETINRFPVVCPFQRFLGVKCYGCGMTRALSAFLHGQVGLALAYNRGVLIGLPILAGMAVLPAALRRRHA